MNIENIEAFVYVVYFNSFHKAADALFLSQPSVSSRIQSLERELGIALFEREGKRFKLTEKGERFLPYAQQTLQSFRKGKQLLQSNKNIIAELKIGCTETVAHYVIPRLLSRFKKDYPAIQLRIITGTSDQLVAQVLGKSVDLAFVRSIAHPDLDSIELLEDPIRLYVYEGHPFARQGEIPLQALEEEVIVFYECGSLNWTRIHRLFDTFSQTPQIDYHIDNMETAKKLIIQKLGIGFLPTLCVEEEVAQGRLIPITIPSISKNSLVTNIVALKNQYGHFIEAFLRSV